MFNPLLTQNGRRRMCPLYTNALACAMKYFSKQ